MNKTDEKYKCAYCGNTIEKPDSYFKKQSKAGFKTFFCNTICYHEYMKQQKQINKERQTRELICTTCGKKFKKFIPDNFFNEHPDQKYFCSHSCSATYYNKTQGLRITEKLRETARSLMINLNKNRSSKQKIEKIRKICPVCKKEFYILPCDKNRIYCSKECYLNDHEQKYRTPVGGLIKGSGRGKKGWYKNYFCDSSWELAFVIYNIDHNIKFERNKVGFDYEYEGKHLKYYPDFILEDGTYVEIKGIMTEINKAKIASFNKPLIVYDKETIKPFLEYAINSYGTDFISLYEGNPHNKRLNKCLICGKPAKNLYCSRECSGKASVLRKLQEKN